MKKPSRHVLTNVRLSLDTLKSLKHRAVEERRPTAVLVREAVERYLLTDSSPPRPDAKAKWLRGLIGAAGSQGKRPYDAAVNHDHYLYGAPRKPAPH